jgi:hypothetical protein
MSNFMKIRRVGADLFHANGQTHDEAYQSLFAILRKLLKLLIRKSPRRNAGDSYEIVCHYCVITVKLCVITVKLSLLWNCVSLL